MPILNITDVMSLAQEDRMFDVGSGAEICESTLSAHACFLIKNMFEREEHIRDFSVSLLNQLRDKFPGKFSLTSITFTYKLSE